MRVVLGNPPVEEHARLEGDFRAWALGLGAEFLPEFVVVFPGLDSHKPDAHIKSDGLSFLVQVETGHSLDSQHTRSQWMTFLAFASNNPNYKFMIILPESCASEDGRILSKNQLKRMVIRVLQGIEDDLAKREIHVDRGRIQPVFL